MRKLGTIMLAIAGAAVAMLALSGGTSQVPQTPQGPDRLATPFLGVAVLGSGGAAAAVDAYGSVVELRAPGPAGPAAISTRYERQRAGSVDEETGIVLRVAGQDGQLTPLWEGTPRQRYIGEDTVLETQARIASVEVRVRDAMGPRQPVFAREVLVKPSIPSQERASANAPDPDTSDEPVQLELSFNFDFGNEDASSTIEVRHPGSFVVSSQAQRVACRQESRVEPTVETEDGLVRMRWNAEGPLRASLLCRFDPETHTEDADAASARTEGPTEPVSGGGSRPGVHAEVARVHATATADARRALKTSAALSPAAPDWARRLHRRSLLTLLTLTDRTTGAMPAGLRDHWHYIWPRDAGTAALALAQAGQTERAERIADFISELDVENAARFREDGSAVDDGRHEQGDSVGWARLAQQAAGPSPQDWEEGRWRGRGDYGERDDDRGDYLANAIVAGASAEVIGDEFAHEGLLVRETGSGQPVLDTAAAWAVRPFPRPPLYPLIRNTLLQLAATAGPYGLFPASDWQGRDPWTAATASTAWSLAALGEREAALRLMHAVRDAATPLHTLPERADIENGLPRSTTPLAWSHAFALLALQELWPPR